MDRWNDPFYNALYSASEVRELDRLAIEEHGISGGTLMRRAGRAVVQAARATWPGASRWHVLCGAGNNAGDGYVIARLAAEAGLQVSLCAMKPPEQLEGDALQAARDWAEAGGTQREGPPPADTELLIDALLGTGLDRPVEGAWRHAIEHVNRLDCPRVAVDIPSGLNADTGRVMGAAIFADLTVTFIGRKRGLYTADGPDHAGQVLFDSLSTPVALHARLGGLGELDGLEELHQALPPRPLNAHKGRFGHVLVVGGNAGMSGAAVLAGEGALRCGAGLVSVASHPVHAHWMNLGRPELMCRAVANAADLAPSLERATVLAVGPGLGADAWSDPLLDACLDSALPLVLDADGLNALSARPRTREQWVLTPHPAEAARLLDTDTDSVQQDRFASARALAERFNAVVVLKGCGTVTAAPNGRWAVCELGNPGMSTGGSGDVLTGVIAALLAQGLEPYAAARMGVAAHAAAGDWVAVDGEVGLLASDIAAALPRVINGAWDEG